MKIGKIRFGSLFLLLICWLFYRDDSGVIWQGFLACVLHECGHCLALRWFGIEVREIRLTLFGAQIKFESHMSYWKECIAAAAGPAVNLLLAGLFWRLSAYRVFTGVNLSLGIFNLLPVGTLDGARILRCIAAIMASESFAARISQHISALVTLLFTVIGLAIAVFGKNVTLLLMCLWLLWSGNDKFLQKTKQKNRNRACQTNAEQLK